MREFSKAKGLLLKDFFKSICIFLMLGSLFIFSSYIIQLFYLILCGGSSFVLVVAGHKNRAIKKVVRLCLFLASLELGLLLIMLTAHFLLGFLNFRGENILETDFFADKNVMVIVPHQDDEINLVGGIIEKYINEGSEVRVVFATNGDFYGIGELRLKEAIHVLTQMGIEEENVLFLGYGSMWYPMEMSDGQIANHIYNGWKDNRVWTSHNEKRETYGLDEHLPYHLNLYTRNNFIGDIEDVILEYQPEVIYVSDYDKHADHRAVSLMFEEAMGDVLSEIEGYTPVVFKGSCYETAWTAADDFLTMNNESTLKGDILWNSIYEWEQRIRIPVDSSATCQVMAQNSVYRALSRYVSQQAAKKSGNIINGDKVFWRRRTDSLLYSAKITYDDMIVLKLNDFKLIDSCDVSDLRIDIPQDGVITIDENKPITIQLDEQADIKEIYLYDNPDYQSNILCGYILFDQKQKVWFDDLNKTGSGTKIECNADMVKEFSIVITKSEGDAPGLTEIEAYQNIREEDSDYIKIIDNKDKFCYDYWIENGDTQDFSIYSLSGKVDLQDCDVQLQGDNGCCYELKKDYVTVLCPEGKRCNLTIKLNGISDTIEINNPSPMKRKIILNMRKKDYDFCTYKNFFTKRYAYYQWPLIRLRYKRYGV